MPGIFEDHEKNSIDSCNDSINQRCICSAESGKKNGSG
jgi:hypothetical protein